MSDGYIKLWRKSIDSGMMKNHKLWTFWTWCLLKASYKEHKTVVGFQEVNIFPGQFIFGIKKASLEIRLTFQEIRTCLVALKKMENLTIKTTNKFSIITICNWETYQNEEIEINNQNNKQLTNKQQTTNNKQELIEGKELKDKKHISSPNGDGYSESFEMFWKEYPKKIGKMGAYKAWKKLKGKNVKASEIIDAIKKQASTNHFNGFIPHASKWINERRWEDEILVSKSTPSPKRNML